jgi:hypothetical protein
MKKETVVDIYAEETNFAVIKISSRKYPGVLIQGDSLYALLSTVTDVIELFNVDKEEAMEGLRYLYDELNWRVECYQEVLKENGEPFPYKK